MSYCWDKSLYCSRYYAYGPTNYKLHKLDPEVAFPSYDVQEKASIIFIINTTNSLSK